MALLDTTKKIDTRDVSADGWTVEDAARIYRFGDWGEGYFGISRSGNVLVHPTPGSAYGIDVLEVVEGLGARELHTPLLLRFSGVLEHRLRHFRQIFDQVTTEAGYRGEYTLAYPIKVNQQRHVCEEIRDVGGALGFGFEAGSKPELIAALGLSAGFESMPILCNGFKDAEYLELVVLASKLGRRIIPVIERFEELETLLQLADEHDHSPEIGVRIRLSAPGSGRWQGTTGARGKFGLSASALLDAVELLRERGRLERLKLVHCHVGSQIGDIAALKRAI